MFSQFARPPLFDLRMSLTLKGLATLSPLAFPHSYTNYLSQSDEEEKKHKKTDKTASQESKVAVGGHNKMLSLGYGRVSFGKSLVIGFS